MHVGKSTLHLKDLSITCDEKTLYQHFVPYGKIINIRIIRNHQTNSSRCFGFVQYASPENASKALEGLNGTEILGRNIK